MNEIRAYIVGAALVVIAAIAWFPILKYGWDNLRRRGLSFCVIMAGFLCSMATKPDRPYVNWDEVLANNGTDYASENSGVNFRWRKTTVALPDDQQVFISKREKIGGTDWSLEATTYVGMGGYDLTIANADQYQYWVWTDWVPPHPVHTNGVWVGNVIEKANGSKGVNKLLIIQGQLIENGKVIAP